jgi:stage V sporulation protein B
MSTQKKSRNSFLIQGTILAVAGLLVRVIGLIYRIPLNNILGTEGAGYYSEAYDIYSILLLLSSLSLPLAVSKLVSAKVAVGQYKNCKKIFTGSIIFALVVGSVVGALTLFGADFLARIWGYPSCAPALRVLAPTLFIMTFVGVLRGYFQGLGSMVPTAVSQIFEQIINAIVSIIAAYKLTQVGLAISSNTSSGNMGAAYGAAGGTLGTCTGAFTAFIFLVIIYAFHKKNTKDELANDVSTETDSYKDIAKAIILTIVPVLVSTTIYNFSNLIDSGIYGNIMKANGISEMTRTSVWGVYAGRYRILSNVPIAIASALSSSIVPSLVLSVTRKEHDEIIRKIESIIKFTMIIAIPCGVGLMVLGRPIMTMLFISEYRDLSCNLMLFSLLTVMTFSLSTITNSILQGIDHLKIPVIHAAVSLGIHVMILYLLLTFTNLGIYGVIISDILFAFVVCVLNAFAIKKYLNYKQEIKKTFILPLLAAAIMGAITYLVYYLLNPFVGLIISTAIAIVVAVIVYALMLIVLKVVTKEELLMMPKGNLIYKIFNKIHLMR